jgi:hypothetical protein
MFPEQSIELWTMIVIGILFLMNEWDTLT